MPLRKRTRWPGPYHWDELVHAGVFEDGGYYRVVILHGEGCFKLVAWSEDRPDWVFCSQHYSSNWHFLQSHSKAAIMASFLRKAVNDAEMVRLDSDARDLAFRGRYPALAEWLSAQQYPDGTARETSTLLAFIEGGLYKGCLNDRDNARGLWASSGSFEGLLEALEGHLQAGTGEWRQSAPRQGARGKKR